MTITGIFFIIFAVLVLLSPWLETEDRADFMRPDRKARTTIGTWFGGARRH